jgi:predicted Zn-dependent protease
MTLSACRGAWAILMAAAWGCVLLPATVSAEDITLESATQALRQGRYAESVRAFSALAADPPTPGIHEAAVLGLAQSYRETGQWDQAAEVLAEARKPLPQASSLPARLADLAYDRGELDAARRLTEEALRLNADDVLARWTQTRLTIDSGDYDAAAKQLDWFIRYQNQHQLTEPETVRVIGLAAAERARWNGLTSQFRFLVNEFVTDQLATDPLYWPAALESGRLLAEKYNTAQATRSFQQALTINSNAAEVYLALADLAVVDYQWDTAQKYLDRALATHPRLAHAHRLLADLDVANFRIPEAIEHLEDARRLNPKAEETLGRLAACYLIEDRGSMREPGMRAQAIIDEVVARNPKPGRFYFSLGQVLDTRRRFHDAVLAYEAASEAMPMLLGPRAAWGQLLMRLGEETRADQLLETSFERDPYNVRVKNTLEVLDQLDEYDTYQTEHFTIRYQGQADRILAIYVGDYLEEQYPALCKQFAFEVPERSLFEIFSKSERTSGHAWFSARMIGLPYLGTVGACAGKMVALTSPNERAYNWARVVKHEFIHVINLQQTDFHLPHWFAEGLAVRNEGYPVPDDWADLVRSRWTTGKAFNLDTINLGFYRPESGDDWQLAYAQSLWYVDYLFERFGPDAAAQLLNAYAAGHETPEAIQTAFQIDQAELEAGYRTFVEERLAATSARSADENDERNDIELQKHLAEHPDDADTQALWAERLLAAKDLPGARQAATKALAIEPKHPLGSYVLSRVVLTIGDVAQAETLMRTAHDPENPHPEVINLLALLETRAKRYDRAAELYRIAEARWPRDAKWTQGLARVYLLAGDTERLTPILERLAIANADDFALRKKLASLARERGDVAETIRWCREANFCNVLDPDVHTWWAEAAEKQSDLATLAREREVLALLEPRNMIAQMAWIRALLANNERERANQTLEKLLQAHPDNAEAEALWHKLNP